MPTRSPYHRTTILLRSLDQARLAAVADHLGGAADIEAIRRSLEVMAHLIALIADGYEIRLEKDGQQHRIILL